MTAGHKKGTWDNCIVFLTKLVLLFPFIGGFLAGREKGDPVLSEGQAANHWCGGEHERLCLPFMQG